LFSGSSSFSEFGFDSFVDFRFEIKETEIFKVQTSASKSPFFLQEGHKYPGLPGDRLLLLGG